ncbi:hypothetical protein AB0D08_24885 [Kitasatospora sp. NPDC048540]|uniref:hypothetical protein n=1 Tax=unclassified Kitasatospora TaxID=2633591 RepID=UPI00053B16AE|nr:hypothetical protein [Kitasatospora sp. MBT63]
MTRKRNKPAPVPARCAAADGPRPVPSWLPGRAEAIVIIVVIALAAALVAAGMSAGAALELAGGSWLLGLRLRRERA